MAADSGLLRLACGLGISGLLQAAADRVTEFLIQRSSLAAAHFFEQRPGSHVHEDGTGISLATLAGGNEIVDQFQRKAGTAASGRIDDELSRGFQHTLSVEMSLAPMMS